MARITYLGHSGFAVDTGARRLIFDCVSDSVPPPERGSGAIVFVSHAHGDHFSRRVAGWYQEGRAELVAGRDVRAGFGGARMGPGDELEISGATVRAFDSTDEGVSFLVAVDGLKIFHAGDLNLWHWRGESTEEEAAEAERAFEAAIAPLFGLRMDAAFFPVDPRMGDGYDEGARRFAELARPKLLIPMHFWGDKECAKRFAAGEMPSGVRALAMTEPGETIEYPSD